MEPTLSPYERQQAVGSRLMTIGRTTISKIVWFGAFVAAIIAALEGIHGFSLADSAPQQGAVAAMVCAYAVVPYVFARAVDALLR